MTPCWTPRRLNPLRRIGRRRPAAGLAPTAAGRVEQGRGRVDGSAARGEGLAYGAGGAVVRCRGPGDFPNRLARHGPTQRNGQGPTRYTSPLTGMSCQKERGGFSLQLSLHSGWGRRQSDPLPIKVTRRRSGCRGGPISLPASPRAPLTYRRGWCRTNGRRVCPFHRSCTRSSDDATDENRMRPSGCICR